MLLLRWLRLVYNHPWHGCAIHAFASLIAGDLQLLLILRQLVGFAAALRLVAVDTAIADTAVSWLLLLH